VVLRGPRRDDLYAFSFDILFGDPERSLSTCRARPKRATCSSRPPARTSIWMSARTAARRQWESGRPAGGAATGGVRRSRARGPRLRGPPQGATSLTLVGSPTNPQNPRTSPWPRLARTRVASVEFDPAAALLTRCEGGASMLNARSRLRILGDDMPIRGGRARSRRGRLAERAA